MSVLLLVQAQDKDDKPLESLTRCYFMKSRLLCFPANFIKLVHNKAIVLVVVLSRSQSSAQLGLVLARAFGQQCSTRLGLPCLPKSSAWLAISCKNSSVQLGLLYDLKNQVTLKTKNELIFNIFATF